MAANVPGGATTCKPCHPQTGGFLEAAEGLTQRTEQKFDIFTEVLLGDVLLLRLDFEDAQVHA